MKRPIAIMTAAALAVTACAAHRPAAIVSQEQAACYGGVAQACADYQQDKAAIDHNAQTAAVLAPLLVIGAVGLVIAGGFAHGPPGPPGPRPLPPVGHP